MPILDRFRLEGKRALVTGAGRGIGEGIALGLAALYAISDEVHQHFVEGRHAAALDVLIDATGALVGVLAWRWLSRRREAR